MPCGPCGPCGPVAPVAPVAPGERPRTWSEEFGAALSELARKDERVVALTAGMRDGTGLAGFAREFPDRFFDVGIAEEFAVTFAGGMAKGGLIPVFAVYSTFLQRAYDEIVHDVAMQNQKVVLAVDRAGFVGDDGRSHQGIFDLAFLRTIPNSVIYSPSTYKGVGQFLYRALYDDGKVIAVRYPRGKQGYIPDLEEYEEPYEDEYEEAYDDRYDEPYPEEYEDGIEGEDYYVENGRMLMTAEQYVRHLLAVPFFGACVLRMLKKRVVVAFIHKALVARQYSR